MICQTVSKKHNAKVFPLTEPLHDSYTFYSNYITLLHKIKLPLSNGQEILLIMNILDKAFDTASVTYKG